MRDSTYKRVKEYLVQRGYPAVPDETYDHIDEWLEWYQNDVEKFHHYKLYNGAVMTNQERYKLGMAKTVCEDWANLLLKRLSAEAVAKNKKVQKEVALKIRNDKIKEELTEAKIRGVPRINPDKIDVSEFSFDAGHINAEREHSVSREEAERFIKEADISLTRWNGRFVNYYGPNGAVYVDTENNNIRTAFKKEQFDEQTLKIREVAEKYGIKKD